MKWLRIFSRSMSPVLGSKTSSMSRRSVGGTRTDLTGRSMVSGYSSLPGLGVEVGEEDGSAILIFDVV